MKICYISRDCIEFTLTMSLQKRGFFFAQFRELNCAKFYYINCLLCAQTRRNLVQRSKFAQRVQKFQRTLCGWVLGLAISINKGWFISHHDFGMGGIPLPLCLSQTQTVYSVILNNNNNNNIKKLNGNHYLTCRLPLKVKRGRKKKKNMRTSEEEEHINNFFSTLYLLVQSRESSIFLGFGQYCK